MFHFLLQKERKNIDITNIIYEHFVKVWLRLANEVTMFAEECYVHCF